MAGDGGDSLGTSTPVVNSSSTQLVFLSIKTRSQNKAPPPNNKLYTKESNTKTAMSADDAKYAAMVEFLGTFPTLSGTPPKTLEELSDGVALFEVLSEM